MNTKSILTIAIAAATIAVGSLAATGEASAKKGGGFHGGRHGGYHGSFHRGHRWGHRWHGHRWHGRYWGGYGHYAPAYYASDCYFSRRPSGRAVKVCPID
jgi:hypothetical protein